MYTRGSGRCPKLFRASFWLFATLCSRGHATPWDRTPRPRMRPRARSSDRGPCRGLLVAPTRRARYREGGKTYIGCLKSLRQLGIYGMQPIDCMVRKIASIQSIDKNLHHTSWARRFRIPMYVIRGLPRRRIMSRTIRPVPKRGAADLARLPPTESPGRRVCDLPESRLARGLLLESRLARGLLLESRLASLAKREIDRFSLVKRKTSRYSLVKRDSGKASLAKCKSVKSLVPARDNPTRPVTSKSDPHVQQEPSLLTTTDMDERSYRSTWTTSSA